MRHGLTGAILPGVLLLLTAVEALTEVRLGPAVSG